MKRRCGFDIFLEINCSEMLVRGYITYAALSASLISICLLAALVQCRKCFYLARTRTLTYSVLFSMPIYKRGFRMRMRECAHIRIKISLYPMA